VLTFQAAAEALIESKTPRLAQCQARRPMGLDAGAYVYPALGPVDVKRIEFGDVLHVLRPIWSTKPETASRVRQRIEAELDYAAAMGARTGDNPARWRGHLYHLLPKPSKVRAVEHHAALDWREAPVFMGELLSRDGNAARGLAFAIVTAARSGEVRGMT
jgi:integrase